MRVTNNYTMQYAPNRLQRPNKNNNPSFGHHFDGHGGGEILLLGFLAAFGVLATVVTCNLKEGEPTKYSTFTKDTVPSTTALMKVPSKKNLLAAEDLSDYFKKLTEPLNGDDYSLANCFNYGKANSQEAFVHDLKSSYWRDNHKIPVAKELSLQSVDDGLDYFNYSKNLQTDEQKIPELMRKIKKEHPEWIGSKTDSAIAKELDSFYAAKDALLKLRSKNYVVHWFNKGIQSINDSVAGKNTKPANVLLNKDFKTNYRLQAYFIGQLKGRADFVAQKTKEVLKVLKK